MALLAFLIHREVLDAMTIFDAELGWGPGITAGVLLAAATLLASYLPARSAARMQPTRALSME